MRQLLISNFKKNFQIRYKEKCNPIKFIKIHIQEKKILNYRIS